MQYVLHKGGLSLYTEVLTQALTAFYDLAVLPLWPGFDPQTVPLVLHSAATAYAVGHPSPPDGFLPAGTLAGRPVVQGPPLPEMAANTAGPIAGVICALAEVPAPGADPLRYARLLLHECFHAYQQTALAETRPSDPAWVAWMGLYPENDPRNNALCVMENRLLVRALAGEREALSRYAAVRLYRCGEQPEAVRALETVVEYTEGTPTYIEYRAGRPLAELAGFLAECNRGGKWAAYRRFYFTGAAIALSLDTLMADWQNRFHRGQMGLFDLLLEALGPALPDPHQVFAAEGFPAVLREEERHDDERRSRIGALLAELDEGPGVGVTVPLPEPHDFGWDPTTVLAVRPGVRLHPHWYCLFTPGGGKLEVGRLCLEDLTERRLFFRLPEPPLITTDPVFRMEGAGVTGQAPAGTATPSPEGWIVTFR